MKHALGRRGFLAGLLTGAGGVVAAAVVPRGAAARKGKGRLEGSVPAGQLILYRRTKEAERYYRTLYT